MYNISMEIENLSKEEILKLIEENKNKDDAKSLYFLSKLYLKIQDYTNALICVVDCLNKDSSYYYDCIDIKLTCLIEKEKYIEALKILDEELSMPFIPRDYEDKFKEKYKFLNSKFNSNNKSNPISELSDEEIGDLLLNIKDTQTLLTIIEVLEKRNIRNFISYIQKYLISENSEIIKSLLLLKLKDQKVDSSIKIKKNELEIELIPSYEYRLPNDVEIKFFDETKAIHGVDYTYDSGSGILKLITKAHMTVVVEGVAKHTAVKLLVSVNDGETVKLDCRSQFITVDWGDGDSDTNHSHTYSTHGDYKIHISGNLSYISIKEYEHHYLKSVDFYTTEITSLLDDAFFN